MLFYVCKYFSNRSELNRSFRVKRFFNRKMVLVEMFKNKNVFNNNRYSLKLHVTILNIRLNDVR